MALSGSVGLLADTIHNFADAATAIPLGIAFLLARRAATRRFTYALGRVEDFAGLMIVVTIAASAVVASYEAIRRLLHPQPIELLWAVMLASMVGFGGNEAIAVLRIRVGRQIGSAALIADGYHARVDGWTSLAVFVGGLGVWAGYPLADPIAGLLISAAIFVVVWQSARAVLLRMLDGVPGARHRVARLPERDARGPRAHSPASTRAGRRGSRAREGAASGWPAPDGRRSAARSHGLTCGAWVGRLGGHLRLDSARSA